MSEYNLYYIIVAGQPETGGVTYIGPFDCEQDAEEEIARLPEDTNYKIEELHAPTFAA